MDATSKVQLLGGKLGHELVLHLAFARRCIAPSHSHAPGWSWRSLLVYEYLSVDLGKENGHQLSC